MKLNACAMAAAALLSASALAGEAGPRCNPLAGEWELAAPEASLEYNALERTRDCAEPGDSLRYNALDQRWQMA